MRLVPTNLPILMGLLCLLHLGCKRHAGGEIPGPSQETNIAASANAKEEMTEALWTAVRNGDTKAITALLEQGADVNAKNKIGVTALWIAAGKGKQNVVELLVGRGADVNARDGIWYQTPLSSAVAEGNAEIVKFLIRSGAQDIDEVVLVAAAGGKTAVIQAILDSSKAKQEVLNAALIAASAGNKEVRAALGKAGATALRPASKEESAAWAPLAGTYENENGGKLTIELTDAGLVVRRFGYPHLLKSTGAETFMPVGIGATYTFMRKGPQVPQVSVKYFTSELTYYRLETKPVATAVRPTQEEPVPIASPLNWPSFRGPDASGVADGQHPPLTWDVQNGINVRWKTPIPGLGHSCPVVWGDRVFVTTAVSGDSDPKVRVGNYGDVASVNDTSEHRWQIFCLDRDSGKILWNRTAYAGVPKIKRHLKGSQANCTPATDGKRVVACFGSEGLYCYDFAGKLLWQRDLGTLDSSFAIDVKYEWGFGSSPILHDDLVILQCDLGKDSFIAAYRLEDGARAWLTQRDEIPSWSTPTIWRNARRIELVTNAAQYARGYDPATGEELWRLDKKSEVTIPTPVIGRDLVFLTSGNRPIQPIFAIRPGSTGDISLKPNEQHNDQIAWSRMRGGPYMTTPILYGNYLYTCGNGGMVSCYQADTGKEIYKERLGGESYTASPIAADQRLYFTSEQGQVRVVKAGPEFQLLAVNEIGDVCMATPAISNGMLFVRSQHFLFALGQKPSEK
jgi:outer membrane protein assembly factor BamB